MNNLFTENTKDESYYKQKLTQLLTNLNISYDEVDESNNSIKIQFSGYNMKNMDVLVQFWKDSIQIGCVIANFENKQEAALNLCNDLNVEYRFLKFYLEKGLMVCTIDSYLSENVGAYSAFDLLSNLIRILDSKYPLLMRTAYSL